MKTINISLTPEQAKYVDKAAKVHGFANRSEFIRAVLRKTMGSPFKERKVIRKLILTLDQIRQKAIPILKKNDVEFAALFGSFARGQVRPDSDIDILVRYDSGTRKSLFDFVGLQQDLTEAMGIKVDLVSERAVHPYIKENIVKDLNIFYGKRQYV